MKYKRILLKLSGEALMGQQPFGIDPAQLTYYADEIRKVHVLGVKLAVVIGGGNIYRGRQASQLAIDQVQCDYMGMLATIMNGIALQNMLEKKGVPVRLMTSLPMAPICTPYVRQKALRQLEKGRVVLLGAGLGAPYFTTDSAASLRAIELEATVMLKGTKVPGIYTADPQKNRDAVKFSTLTFQEVYQRKFKVMDMTALTLCEENNLPIVVFDATQPDNLLNLVKGACVGTLVS